MGAPLTPAELKDINVILQRIREHPFSGMEAQTLGGMYDMHLRLSAHAGEDGRPWSRDTLGKVLAYTTLSGGDENCVLNKTLNAIIQIAQREFGILGGCIPDAEKMRTFYWPRVKELGELGKQCPWIAEFCKRYSIELKWQQFEAYYADYKEGAGRWLAQSETADDKAELLNPGSKRVIRDRQDPDANSPKQRIIRDR